ncbi:MAG TPA: phenylalanine--tRNA ligase subunit alpha [Thermoplasmata archaeon]|nr:phenylalanine--tRNA ligase subunit alpha [Thermoplasmata archaeon]
MPGASDDAPDGAAPLDLSGPERSVLELLRSSAETPVDEEEVVRRSGQSADQVRGSLQRLRSKHLAVVQEQHERSLHLTPRGTAALEHGLPERRLLDLLERKGPVAPTELGAEGLDDVERTAAIGILRRRGLLEDGVPLRLRPGAAAAGVGAAEVRALRAIADRREPNDDATLVDLERRGLVRSERRSRKRWAPSEEGRRLELVAEGVEPLGALSPSLLASAGWKGRPFRPYDVRAAVPFVTGARRNRYLAWLERFEEVLVGLGFEEALGPLLETEFWNNDVLFMPQDHPARSIHDALAVEGVDGQPPPPELLSRVAAVHEGRPLPGETVPIGPGWGVAYDPLVARRPTLRSQTTAVSARFLARRPRPPFRMYSVDRNFRREKVDAQHHLEFWQAEGIVGAPGMNVRHLVGLFRELAEAIGIRDMKIRPSYFPFTEPSIEGYVRHPRLGWMEVFPGGLFRPEVLRPLGIDVPVLAWGVGVTRLAMVALGCNDIRELFADDLDELRGAAP